MNKPKEHLVCDGTLYAKDSLTLSPYKLLILLFLDVVMVNYSICLLVQFIKPEPISFIHFFFSFKI
jgi:hypothetical protein